VNIDKQQTIIAIALAECEGLYLHLLPDEDIVRFMGQASRILMVMNGQAVIKEIVPVNLEVV